MGCPRHVYSAMLIAVGLLEPVSPSSQCMESTSGVTTHMHLVTVEIAGDILVIMVIVIKIFYYAIFI